MILSLFLSEFLFVHLNCEKVCICICIYSLLMLIDSLYAFISTLRNQNQSLSCSKQRQILSLSLERERGMLLSDREVDNPSHLKQTRSMMDPWEAGNSSGHVCPPVTPTYIHAKSKKSFFIFRPCRCRAKELFSPAPTLLVVISTLIIHW